MNLEEDDDCFVICPHCRAKYQPEACDYSEEYREEECDKCGKTYTVWQVFSVTHYTRAELDAGEGVR